jgi:hypothetical protein
MDYEKEGSLSPAEGANEVAEPATAYAVRGKAVREPWEVPEGDSEYGDFYDKGGALSRGGAEDSGYDPYKNDDWVRDWVKYCEENYTQSEEDKRFSWLFKNDPEFRKHFDRVTAKALAGISAENRDSSSEELDVFWEEFDREIDQYDRICG